MCGIIGSIGVKNAVPVLLKGLERLEYRGYDSAGICVVTNNSLVVIKKTGKVAELAAHSAISSLKDTTIGIAHTRWATHGKPSEENAHPHLDCKGEIAIVHNGIIENYHKLKNELEEKGHVFRSETDSEIVAHLIEYYYNGNLERAVIMALKKVEGAFGLAVMHKSEKSIVAARRGSPLVLGISDGAMFVASDVSALLDYTSRVIYLDDNEVATLTSKSYTIKTLEGNMIRSRAVQEIDWNIDKIEKRGYKHFMLKEILEQPISIEKVLQNRIINNRILLDIKIDINTLKRLYIVACGTSWHAALEGKYIIERIAGIPVEVDYASEFRYRNPLFIKGDAIIAISQSGETADTLAAIRLAKEKSLPIISIVNVVGSGIARNSDSVIYLNAGPEIGVASTKAFTAQIMALVLFALYIKQERNDIADNEILNSLKVINCSIKEVLKSREEIKKIADEIYASRDALYLGRGMQFPVALEGALKLKEISYIHAEGYPAAEMKHGPIALVEEGTPVIALAMEDVLHEKMISNIQEVKARKGKVIAITDSQSLRVSSLADRVIKVPKVLDILSPIVTSIPLQLLAYYAAVKRGIDVDKPRNLAKSVTVE